MYPEATLKRTSPGVSIVLEAHAPFRWGAGFLLLFTLFIVGRIHEVVPGLASMQPVLISGALAALFWLLAPGSLQDKIPVGIPQVKYVVWLFVLAVLLVPVGVWPRNSVLYIVDVYWKTVLFFLMVVFWARSVVDMRRIIWASCLGVSILVLSGLASGVFTERFQAGSRTYDANDLALVLVITLPLLIYLFSSSGLALKFIASAMIFICLYGIILTSSRGGFIALLAVALLIVFRTKIGKATKVGILVLALVVFGSLAGGKYWDRMSTLWSPGADYEQVSTGRIALWKVGLKILATHPWGVGIHNYSPAQGLSEKGHGQGGVGWTTAHNSFIQLGVELGVVGLFVFIVMITSTLKDLRSIQAIPRDEFPRKMSSRQRTLEPPRINAPLKQSLLPLASALETSLLGFVVGGFFLSQAYSPVFYCILALGLSCKRLTQETAIPIKNERIIKISRVVQG